MTWAVVHSGLAFTPEQIEKLRAIYAARDSPTDAQASYVRQLIGTVDILAAKLAEKTELKGGRTMSRAPLLHYFWSDEARKRIGFDETIVGGGMATEPYDRVAVLGVEMSFDELRGIVQDILDAHRAKMAAR